jgi:hypothetical protein
LLVTTQQKAMTAASIIIIDAYKSYVLILYHECFQGITPFLYLRPTTTLI